jgi:hypothetical protein
VITLSQVFSVTQAITDPTELANWPAGIAPEKLIGYQRVYSGGFSIISGSSGYTESHVIHAVAYDSAGNEIKTEAVRVMVTHRREKDEEKDEENPEAADDSQAYLLPSFYNSADFSRKKLLC